MQEKFKSHSAFFSLRTAILLLCGTISLIAPRSLLAFFSSAAPARVSQRTLTFQERVSYQRSVEEVYWHHRIWPKENLTSKPSLDAVMSEAQLEKKVSDYLRNSQALEDYWQRPITAEQLQAEMDRMARHTKQPEVLRELFEVLGNDPFIIAECLARPILAQRLPAHFTNEKVKPTSPKDWQIVAATVNYALPTISDTLGGCIDDSWASTNLTAAPDARFWQTAVWTGSEMIVWGGTRFGLNTGARYNPSTDSWTATTITNAPSARAAHTAVWTGSEMIIWGGESFDGTQHYWNTGGRYNPNIDSWTATSTTNAPDGRYFHAAVWTGSEMIVWGGTEDIADFNTGGRYNPSTDSWTATTATNAPFARYSHTAVWTGSEMIVWGGGNVSNVFNTGGKYNPSTDTWTATDTANSPTERTVHTAVWSGTKMIVWGGYDGIHALNTGGSYSPNTNSWTATSTTNAADARISHTAIWTGSEMIVWGGSGNISAFLNTGGRYDTATDSWTATSATNAPDARYLQTAVWTGTEMIVWGGSAISGLNTGGRYCAATPRTTPRPRPTPHPRPTPP
jgi:N-acetylneuraminic acid mutarotase